MWRESLLFLRKKLWKIGSEVENRVQHAKATNAIRNKFNLILKNYDW